MPISSSYRPAAVVTSPAQVDLDGWAAGQLPPGVVDDQGTLWLLQNFDGWWGAPAPRTAFAPIPGNHGAYDAPAYLDARVMVLEGVAVALDLPSARHSRDVVASVCGDPSATATLVVTEPGQPQRQCVVRRAAETKTKALDPLRFAWSMLVTAPDPRRYAVAQSTASVGLPGAGNGGLVFPLVFPLTFGTGALGGQIAVTNSGTLQTWPTFNVLGPVTAPIIRNADTGESLEFDPTFTVAAGQTLVINTANRTASYAGANVRARLFTASWFPLNPGVTNLAFSSLGSYDASAQLTASWRNAWT